MIIIMHDEFDCDILVQFCAIVRTRMFDGVSATTDSTSMRLTASTFANVCSDDDCVWLRSF
jgi:hypothetical protein